MSKILWEPKKNNIKDTNMFSLYETAFKKKLSNADEFNYDLLHKWSLDNVEEFWSLVWDDSNIIGTKGTNIINNYNDLIKSTFFPEGYLNFSENLLAGKDTREAIVFYDESKERQSLSLKELREKVITLAKWLTKNGVEQGDRVAVLATNSPVFLSYQLPLFLALPLTSPSLAAWNSALFFKAEKVFIISLILN